MQSISLFTVSRPVKNAPKSLARQILKSTPDSVTFGQAAPPRKNAWAALAMTLAGMLTGGLATERPVLAQTPDAVASAAPKKVDFSDATTLRKLANDSNPKIATALAERLEKIQDPALRKEITNILLDYRREDALKRQEESFATYQKLDEWDIVFETQKDVIANAQATIEKIEKEGIGGDIAKKALEAAKLLIAQAEKISEKAEGHLVELGNRASDLDIELMDLNTVTGTAIKYGLTTFNDQPDYQAEAFKKLLSDPRGKVRLVAANYLATLSNDTQKAELAQMVGDYALNQKFYPEGSEGEVPLNSIGSAAVHAAATIQEQALKIKTLTFLSQQPLSSVKNAVTSELAGVTRDYEQYKDMVIGASSSTIPGQFRHMEEVLAKWPQPVLKDLSVALSERGMNPKNAGLPDAYSRALGVVLLKNLPASEDAYKLKLLKQAVLDQHTDPAFAATTVGYPFADKAINKELNQYYRTLSPEAAPNTQIARAYGVATSRQFDYTQPELEKILTEGAADTHETVRIYTAISVDSVQDVAFRKALLTRLLTDQSDAVKEVAGKVLKHLEAQP